MSAALKIESLSVVDYLEGEQESEVRHEYIGGAAYAMAGSSENHNLLAVSLVSNLRAALRGRPCRAFISDMKVHIMTPDGEVFYYPDVLVTCDPRDTDPYFKKFPKLIVEVISESTQRLDRGEKFWNYTQIESLEEYVLVSQSLHEVIIFRRSNQWKPEQFHRLDEVIQIPSLNFSLPLRELYEGVTLGN